VALVDQNQNLKAAIAAKDAALAQSSDALGGVALMLQTAIKEYAGEPWAARALEAKEAAQAALPIPAPGWQSPEEAAKLREERDALVALVDNLATLYPAIVGSHVAEWAGKQKAARNAGGAA
jgi:hypothetical protein